MDFKKMLSAASGTSPIEPRELYEALPNKAAGYGYLRDVQGQVLTAWHLRRLDSDIVVKVNTGGGKTIDGLVILQSYLNAGVGPALYVAPSRYLAEQVREEARRLGIDTVDDPDSRAYLRGEAIGVITADKLVNGRSVFSHQRPTKSPAPIGAVVIDDAHAAIAITRSDLSIELPRDHEAFEEILQIFEGDLRQQSPNAYLDIEDNAAGALARVPFWAWRSHIDQVRTVLHKHRDTPPLRFTWPAVGDVLHLCRAVFTARTLSITPPCPPILHITGFAEAQHRVYLTATLADDSVLVTAFGADPESVRRPITPETAGDIGERMIIAPQDINPGLATDDIRDAIADLASDWNVVVIVPSDRAASAWTSRGARFAAADQVGDVVADLRSSHLGLVVLANKYDGIDLPGDACRVLVLDGLPEAFGGEDRLQAQLVSRAKGIDDRQIQRIEQGMGRGVRSNEDHCVVFLLGPRLSQLIADPRTSTRFSAATQAQLELSREVAQGVADQPMSDILAVAKQALGRDADWIKLAKLRLANIPAPSGAVSDVAVERRAAFEAATNGDFRTSVKALSRATAAAESDQEAGWLLEEQAAYLDHLDPEGAQKVLLTARSKNQAALRVLSGVNYELLKPPTDQAKQAAAFLGRTYKDGMALRLGFESLLDDLVFDPANTEAVEIALRDLGEHLGLTSQRPEHETGAGPDVLWGLTDTWFWVIEAKSGSISDLIHKRDANQLGGSVAWFKDKYSGTTANVQPVMMHPAKTLARDATATPGMRVLDESALDALKARVRAFAAAAATTAYSDPATIAPLLTGHELHRGGLYGLLKSTRQA